jgi:ELWxxDGT repeat protein
MDINPGPDQSWPDLLTNANGRLFFRADDGTHGFETWTSDGTAAGTFLLKDIVPASITNLAGLRGSLAAVGDTVFFAPLDAALGFELWKSDGTSAGTVLVKDTYPGPIDGALTGPVAAGSAVVFWGNDGVSGEELWASDGTTANTHVVADIGGPDGGSSINNPHLFAEFTTSGSLLFFEATTNETGQELFAVPIAALMDSDLDGLDYAAETANGTDPFDADSDDDGLSDGAEVLTHGTDPLDEDTDGDSAGDGVEIAAGTDPLDPESFPPAVPLSGPWGLGVLAALLLSYRGGRSARHRRVPAQDSAQ